MVEHRLEGRRLDRVLDDIFAMQAQLLGQVPEERRQRTAS
jgi:TolB-like protein